MTQQYCCVTERFYNYEEPAFENRKYKPSENVKSTEHCEHGDAKGYSRV
eukprot:COSAG01_NODE_1463_length_10232_cov_5.501234_12_plen_49_part_00